MSNQHNEQTLEQILEGLIKDDEEGKQLIDSSINDIAKMYDLHPDDDRDGILFFLAENIFYNA